MTRSSTETLTEAFYAWERRGRGWQLWTDPVELEPAFRPLVRARPGDDSAGIDDGRRPTLLSNLADRLLGVARGRPNQADGQPGEEFEEPEPDGWVGSAQLSELVVAVPPDMKISREVAEQLLLAIPPSADPVAFELMGAAEQVRLLLTCASEDEPSVTEPLKAYFPEVLVSKDEGSLDQAWYASGGGAVVIAELGLAHEFMIPLRTMKKLDIDPLAGIVAVLAGLQADEVGVFQVLFRRARHPWAKETMRAVLDDRGSPFFIDAPEVSAGAKAKVSRPLFACVIRIGVHAENRPRALDVARRLTAALGVLADPLGNELIPLENLEPYEPEAHVADLLCRRTCRSGMILSSDELVSLVHLPTSGVRDPRLLRHGQKTKAAPRVVQGAGVSIGQNIHDGKPTEVRLSADQRSRHTYVIGASGTGKSTLLLNLIAQDLESGAGVAVLDPHGDLIDRILGFVPEHRIDDVVLLDPADSEFPIGFNILSAASDLEKTLLASDLVTTFQRLSTSWGDQMTSVLGNTILAFLENDRRGTLIDVRRFLVEVGFRREVLQTVRDPEIAYFWENEFPLLRGKPQAPILTRLDTFLRPKPIRHMVAQAESRLDLRQLMDEGRILLCRLSHGAIGEENAYLLGTLLVSKLHQVAVSRQDVAEEQRRPFHLYVDEFHNFVTPSMASILSGDRKYGLSFVLAHQDLRQLQSRNADVLAAVLTNPCTRVCFRVGDDDARLLAKGFASFTAEDLQSLGTGEAIARVERADFDFNLRTRPLAHVDQTLSASKRDRIVAQTRERYARPRAEIEALIRPPVAPSPPPAVERPRVERPAPTPPPPQVPAQAAPEPTPPPVSTSTVETVTPAAGRGGQQHRYLQELIRRWAEAHEWGAKIEERVLDGLGSVDVALRKGGSSVACEIVVSSPAEHEVENLQKCLAAGFLWVVEVSTEKRRLGQVKSLAKSKLPQDDFVRVAFVSPEELFELLPSLESPAVAQETTVRGYRVRVRMKAGKQEEHEETKSAVSAVIAKALRRIKSKSKGKG